MGLLVIGTKWVKNALFDDYLDEGILESGLLEGFKRQGLGENVAQI
jgi:hypothetical protein